MDGLLQGLAAADYESLTPSCDRWLNPQLCKRACSTVVPNDHGDTPVGVSGEETLGQATSFNQTGSTRRCHPSCMRGSAAIKRNRSSEYSASNHACAAAMSVPTPTRR
jgi:hypothetical protein